MTSIHDSPSDHAYFLAIEEAFIRLRGAPLLLSPADWQLAKQWRHEGIPTELILSTLEEIFAARAARGARGRVQGLRYCASAVESAWRDQNELSATASRRPSTPVDVKGRLDALAGIMKSHPAIPAELRKRVSALEGAPEEVEKGLLLLDREVLRLAKDELDDDVLEELEGSVKQSMRTLEPRLSREELDRVRERLLREGVRRRLGYPVLSLFAAHLMAE